jgi:Ca2+-binding EF-hand superfamily protein
MVKEVDLDENGTIEFNEFVQVTGHSRVYGGRKLSFSFPE